MVTCTRFARVVYHVVGQVAEYRVDEAFVSVHREARRQGVLHGDAFYLQGRFEFGRHPVYHRAEVYFAEIGSEPRRVLYLREQAHVADEFR